MTQMISQTFDVKGGPHYGRENVPKLRAALDELGLDGFLIPHEDEYDNEYLPDCNERLLWVTGFSGSAGAALVMKDRAAVFVDGRYTLQVKDQVDGSIFEYCDLVEQGLYGWIEDHGRKGEKIGYDARLHSPAALNLLRTAAQRAGVTLVSVKTNPVDAAWTDRPEPPKTPVIPHPIEFAGEDHASKRSRIGIAIRRGGADAAVITAPPSIAWLFNVRGSDVSRSPLPLSAAMIDADGTATFFVDPDKISDETRSHLGNEIALRPESEFGDALAACQGKTVRVDPTTASAWVLETLETGGASVQQLEDPVMRPKAAKNAAEVEGSRQAHIRDGGAIVKFLHWLDTEAQSGQVDEIQAAQKLESLRKQLPELRDLSFDTISGAQGNGAFAHYRVSEETNLKLAKGSLYLVDSGGQYPDGTTDITRTVPIGEPTDEMRTQFTRVLKGHIALSMVRYPKGTTGTQLDILARYSLWQAGFDYDHGTGHGVGSFLGVHEGPQRISKAPNAVALEPGMIVSNEPGFYKADGYGIRIENLQVVTAAEEIPGGERPMLGFETLTVAPIHKGLIDTALLTAEEISWLDSYHALVRERVLPLVDGDVADWLVAATEPLAGA
ncbi:aminopeptidase P family protein [Maricaulis parjimensis]|uniref:aminopeptidase P family protein n=1 Tax=Maricaulis parjimensis TaxID=144023 RepID=UPI001939688E|nr:aminopeptidase P family protein [Maricaulis parjimensis]